MKQRITYIRSNDDEFHPDQLEIIQDFMHIKSLEAAKEHRITIGLSKLPSEVADLLNGIHELHIRWASPQHHPSVDPFSSRLSPGLHVFLDPGKKRSVPLLCPTLKTLFSESLKCRSLDTFTIPTVHSSRLTYSIPSQYHAVLPSLADFVSYLDNTICRHPQPSCHQTTSSLLSATSLDIDFDAASNAVTMTAFWPTTAWDERITASSPSSTTEIGVLNPETPPSPNRLSLGGFLTDLSSPPASKSATLFSFPTRHFLDPHTFTASFSPQNDTSATNNNPGLHPTLHIHLPALTQPHPSCKLHAYLTLPTPLFIDRHAFRDALFLASHNLVSLVSLSGATNLEAPDWAVEAWGSAALLQLAVPHEAAFAPSVPLHLRYLAPASRGHVHVPVSPPVVFWACARGGADEDAVSAWSNPFDRTRLGYDSSFVEGTVFHHLQGGGMLGVEVPVLDLGSKVAAWVEGGTVAAVVMGLGWVVWCLVGPLGAVSKGVRIKKKKTTN